MSISYQKKTNLSNTSKAKKDILKAVWIYFYLLFIEGALRKWVLPGLSTPLLIVRDPIAIYILWTGIQMKALKGNSFVSTMVLVTIISFLMTMLIGHKNLFVAVFGARIFLLYFPMIFVVGKVLDYDDVVNIGRALLWISIGMTVIIALQFSSPQSARINVGLGGEGSSGFVANGAGDDVFRPSGTFSFTLGITGFYSFVAAYIFFFWLRPKLIKKYLLIAATLCLVMAIPLSISRGLLVNVMLCGAFALVPMVVSNPKLIIQMGGAVIALFIIFSLLSRNVLFEKATKALTGRIESANTVDDNTGKQNNFITTVWERGYEVIVKPIQNGLGTPLFGLGLGLGTNVGSALATGSITYLISEGEISREFGEMGIILGGILIFMRITFLIRYFNLCRSRMQKGNYLPWMLYSASAIPFITGQFGQMTALGFVTLGTGLMLGAFNNYQPEFKKK